MDFVFLLRVLRDALRLLDIANEMAEGILPAIAEADRPFPGSRWAAEDTVNAAERNVTGIFAASERAKHGRALPCGHSTLAVGTLRDAEHRQRRGRDGQ
jgi:hypothetical protein